jgi:adenosylcobinamide-GDP ribazoletransferase
MLKEFALAVAFLTRLPLKAAWLPAEGNLGRASPFFPLAGALIAILLGLVYWLAGKFGLPPDLAAAIAFFAGILVTGALHEDGLADACDGLGGGKDRAAKLAILRDSHIGSFGVLGLMASVILRLLALMALAKAGYFLEAVIAVHALSRAPLALLIHLGPYAREDGLARSCGAVTRGQGLAGLALSLIVVAPVAGPGPALLLLALALLAAGGTLLLARAQVGGITGDILGLAQQLAEVLLFLALVSLL